MVAAGARARGRCRRSSWATSMSAASTRSTSSTGPASSTRCSRAAEPMRAALVQLCSGDDPAANLAVTEALVREAAAGGAALVLTPECTNIVSAGPRRGSGRCCATEAEDPTLARLARGGGGARGLAADRLALPQERRGGRALRQPLVPDRAGRRRARPLRQDPHVRRGARRRRELPRVARPTGRASGRCWPRRRG